MREYIFYLRKDGKDIEIGKARCELPDKIMCDGHPVYARDGDKYVVKTICCIRVAAWIEDNRVILNGDEPGIKTFLGNLWWYHNHEEVAPLYWRLKK